MDKDENLIENEDWHEEDIESCKLSSKEIDAFINFLQLGIKLSAEDLLAMNEMNNKQQDLLHDLEIPDKLYVKDITSLGKEIRTLRRNRRKIKDELLLAEVLSSFVKNHPSILSDLKALSLAFKEKETFLSNRTYIVKSSLITTTAIENKKLKSDDNKIIMTINKILKKWSNNNHEAVFEDNQSNIPGNIHHIINFQMTNMGYDFYAARSSFNNFKMLIEKDLKDMFPAFEMTKFSLSNMALNNYENKNSSLGCTMDIKIDNGVTYTLNGKIIFKLFKPSVPRNKKPKKRR